MKTAYSLLLLLLLAGCRKADEGPTSASGRVVDTATGQGVGGAVVTLYASGGGGNILTGSSPQVQQQTTTDAQGHYALSFEADKERRYELQGAAAGFLNGSSESQPRVALTKGRKNEKDVPLRPEAYLRVRFLSPNPMPNTLVNLVEPPTYDAYARANAVGSPVDTSFVVTTKGGEQAVVRWVVYPGGIGASSHEQMVFCPAHDTTDFTIRF